MTECDLSLKAGSSILLAGSSQSGKTYTAFKILRYAGEILSDPRCAQNVHYYYKTWQSAYEENKHLVTQFHNFLPTPDDIADVTEHRADQGGSIVILDDFGGDISKNISEFFRVQCHHFKIMGIIMIQNLFSKNSAIRDLSLNTRYTFVYKNARDKSQISYLARQIEPKNQQFIINAYYKATEKGYSYLLFDHRTETLHDFRVLSHFFPDEHPLPGDREPAVAIYLAPEKNK